MICKECDNVMNMNGQGLCTCPTCDYTYDQNPTTKPKIIMISGYRRSGKNYVADKLEQQLNIRGYTVNQLSFAAPMKRIIANTFDISVELLELYKNKPESYPLKTPNKVMDFRQVLQNFGTEGMKPEFGYNIWGELMVNNLKVKTSDYVIITDARYDLEYKTLMDAGYKLINLRVEGLKPDDTHSSEVLPTIKPDFTINNLDKEDIEDPLTTFLATKLHI